MEFMNGEGLLMDGTCQARINKARELIKHEDLVFPDGITEWEKIVAVVAASGRCICVRDENGSLGEELSLQEKLDMYFAGKSISLPEGYHVHHGFPW